MAELKPSRQHYSRMYCILRFRLTRLVNACYDEKYPRLHGMVLRKTRNGPGLTRGVYELAAQAGTRK